MKRFAFLLFAVALLSAPPPAPAAPRAGSFNNPITSTSPTASTPVALPVGFVVITCNPAAYGNFGATNSVTVSSTVYGVFLEANRPIRTQVLSGNQFFTELSVAGANSCSWAQDG